MGKTDQLDREIGLEADAVVYEMDIILLIASSLILVSVLFIGPSSLLPLDLKKNYFITSFCAFLRALR